MELDFCKTLEDLYQTRSAIGRSGNPFALTSGLSTVNNLLAIRKIMLETKPQRTLEIGMACGGSALTFASTHRDLNHLPNRQHVAIDGFQLNGFDDVGRIKLEEAGLSQYVDIREQLSALELPKMVAEDHKFQLVYIDGSHEFDDVFVDFYFVCKLISGGGYVLFDDASDPKVRKVIHYIKLNLKASFELIPVARYHRKTLLNDAKYYLAETFGRTQLAIFRKRDN